MLLLKLFCCFQEPPLAADPRCEFEWRGGESAGLARIREYLDSDALGLHYVACSSMMIQMLAKFQVLRFFVGFAPCQKNMKFVFLEDLQDSPFAGFCSLVRRFNFSS